MFFTVFPRRHRSRHTPCAVSSRRYSPVHRRRLFLEQLEQRIVFTGTPTGIAAYVNSGQLVVGGTAQNDTIVIDQLGAAGAEIRVLDNGTVAFTAATAAVSSVYVAGWEGDDSITIDASLGALSAQLYGNAGSDALFGGPGNDLLVADANDTQLIGGDGSDSLDFSPETRAINFTNTAASSFEALYGGSGNDTLDSSASTATVYLSGNAGNDLLTGGSGSDYINGDAGDDILHGNVGDDQCNGGLGSDTFTGDAGNDWLFADAADSQLQGGDGSDTFTFTAETQGVTFTNNGTTAFEAIYGGSGNDTIDCSAITTPMTIAGGAGDDILIGGSGNDSLDGGLGNDTLIGGDGADYLVGGAGADSIDGGNGDNYLSADAADTSLLGGSGSDSLNFAAETSDVNFLNTPAAAFEAIYGGSGNDTLDSSPSTANLIVSGGAGNDLLIGGSGNDYLAGNAGDDVLGGLAGDDTLVGGDGNDALYGGDGTDSLDGGGRTNLLDQDGDEPAAHTLITSFTASGGILQVNYALSRAATGPFTVVLYASYDGSSLDEPLEIVASGDAATSSGPHVVTFSPTFDDLNDDYYLLAVIQTPDEANDDESDNVRPFAGGSFIVHEADSGKTILQVFGSSDADAVAAMSSNSQTLQITGLSPQPASFSLSAFDEIHFRAGQGNDAFSVASGVPAIPSWLFGGDGDDTLAGTTATDLIFGGAGNDILGGGAGDDTLDGGDGVDNLSGGLGNDSLAGGAGADSLSGGDGSDTMDGGDDDDTLTGDGGDDDLYGGLGNDALDGGAGFDTTYPDYQTAEDLNFAGRSVGVAFDVTRIADAVYDERYILITLTGPHGYSMSAIKNAPPGLAGQLDYWAIPLPEAHAEYSLSVTASVGLSVTPTDEQSEATASFNSSEVSYDQNGIYQTSFLVLSAYYNYGPNGEPPYEGYVPPYVDPPATHAMNDGGEAFTTVEGGTLVIDNTQYSVLAVDSDATYPRPGTDDNGLVGHATAELVQDALHGHVTLNANGTFTYTPFAGFWGQDIFRYKAIGQDESNIATVAITVERPLVDLDTDSDNTGIIEGSILEETDEMKAPGNIIRLNSDDDNADGVREDLDSGPFVDLDGLPMADNDLEPLAFSYDTTNPKLNGYKLSFSTSSSDIKLWKTPDKQALSVFTIGAGTPIPDEIYVEGLGASQPTVTLNLVSPDGFIVAQDKVLVSVVVINAIGYRPQTVPFKPWKVPEGETVGIRKNGDDDDKNGAADRFQAPIAGGDNDLIQVDLLHKPAGGNGLRYEIARDSASIQVWSETDKSGPLLTNGNGLFNTGPVNANKVWVEWSGLGSAPATFEYSVWDARHNRKAMIDINTPIIDTLIFKPFTSASLFILGNLQSSGFPDPGHQGLEKLATTEYQTSGRDVYLFDHSDVGVGGSGPAFEEIVSAVNNRDVTDVAIMGYSWGGGATHDLSECLVGIGAVRFTNPFAISFTGYVDAITHYALLAETERPPGSLFHVNQYQRNTIPVPNGLSSGGDIDLDQSALQVTHYTIDDDWHVLDLLQKQFRLHILP